MARRGAINVSKVPFSVYFIGSAVSLTGINTPILPTFGNPMPSRINLPPIGGRRLPTGRAPLHGFYWKLRPERIIGLVDSWFWGSL